MTQTSAPQRDYRIDVLRGLAIVAVLLNHFDIAYRLRILDPLPAFLGHFAHLLGRNGNYGVTVFFVISGYLITSTSMRRFGSLREVSPRVFYAFRAARILPCLLLALFLITGLALAGVPMFPSKAGSVPLWLADLSVLTFWHNLLMARAGYFNYCLNVYWSLSVEEVFYLAFPLLCLLRRTRWILLFWLAAIIAGPIYRSMHSVNEIEYLYGDLACFDAIALGCCVAVLAPHFKGGIWLRRVMQFAALAFMTGLYFWQSIDDVPVWGTSLMAIGAAVFLLAESGMPQAISRSARTLLPLAWLGKHSYEVYLFHILILAGLRDLFAPAKLPVAYKLPCLLLFVLLSAGVAALIAAFYSEPLNQWFRKKLAPRSLTVGASVTT